MGQGGHDRWAGESDRWRWPVVLLVVVLHLGLYLLLRSAVGAMEPVRTAETQRIRLVWSERERSAPATPQDPSSAMQAARPLPQLPITVDSEGYLVARSDFHEPVGPAYSQRIMHRNQLEDETENA